MIESDAVDGFWKGVYQALGREDITSTLETFVEGKRVRSYFNSHAFSVNPSVGLLDAWFDRFEYLVRDEQYQSTYCQDELHRIFLHQAVWSVLLVDRIEPMRLNLLPPDYNYPYNLQSSVPVDRRAKVLNDLTSIAYEDRSLNPDRISDIEILDPLRQWLIDHPSLTYQ